jgi:plastocyanin
MIRPLRFSITQIVLAGCITLLLGSLFAGQPSVLRPNIVHAATVGIDVINYDYQPNPLTINVGDTVTWTNASGSIHNVVSGANETSDGLFASGDMVPNNPANRTFSRTFTQAGTYSYFCSHHGGMFASIIVQGGPTATSTATSTATATATATATPTGTQTTATPTATATQTPVAPNLPYRIYLPAIS